MKYEVMIRDGAGLAVWVCGWYQGEEDWNNDAPAVEASGAMEAAVDAARQALACKTVSFPFRGGEFAAQAVVRIRDDMGRTMPEGEFKVTLRAIVASVEPAQ